MGVGGGRAGVASVRRAGVFLDRDGVINEPVRDPRSGLYESPYEPELVTLCDGAAGALRALRGGDLALVVVSNQPAAAKGTATVEALLAVQERVESLLAAEGIELDARRICLHYPSGRHATLGVRCECRKPAPGMLLDAACELELELAECWMVGDSDRDVEAGRRAGCRTVLVEHPRTAHRRGGLGKSDVRARNLAAAAMFILRSTALS